nr:PaREP1 family protein [Caldivirga sp.]
MLDGLVEARLALEMLNKDLLQNASAKVIMSSKSIISSLIVKNIDKIVEGKDTRERDWYENVGYSASTTGLIGISRDLRKLGIDVKLIVRMVLSLHRFSYNGLDPNLVDYRNLNEVKEDLVEVLK